LDTTSKQLEDSRIELTVTIPSEDVDKGVAAAYKEAGKVRIPGFRPGKAPRHVLENAYGGKEYFLGKATDELVKATTPRAVDGAGFVILDDLKYGEIDLVAEGAPFVYTVTFVTAPVLGLSSYDPVQIELPSAEPEQEEIDRMTASMLEYYVTYDEVTGRAAQDGDTVTISLECTIDGKDLEGLTGDDRTYEVGAKTMPDDFDSNIKGMKIGEAKEFDCTFEDDPLTEVSEKGKTMHVKASLSAIRVKQLPELTDAWVKETIEYESVEEFKTRIAESIVARKETELPPLKEFRCSEELLARLEGEPSETMVKFTEQSIYQDFFASLQKQNMSFDQYLYENNVTPDQFRADMHTQAVNNAATTLALDAFARHLGLEVTDDDLFAEFENSGAPNPAKLLDEWRAAGRLSEVREGILRIKASRHVNETAEVFAEGKKPAAKAAKPPKATKAAKPKKEDAEKPAEEPVAKPARKPRAKKADTAE